MIYASIAIATCTTAPHHAAFAAFIGFTIVTQIISFLVFLPLKVWNPTRCSCSSGRHPHAPVPVGAIFYTALFARLTTH
jgi:hypothetical protein